jgi:hypothetical protein
VQLNTEDAMTASDVPKNLAGMTDASMPPNPPSPPSTAPPPPPAGGGSNIQVQLARPATARTTDQALWAYIRASTDAIGYKKYASFLDGVLCGEFSREHLPQMVDFDRGLPFPRVEAYALLKVASEVFLMLHCGIDKKLTLDPAAESTRFNRAVTGAEIADDFSQYVDKNGVLPYLDIIRAKLGDVPIKDASNLGMKCFGILRDKLRNPCMLELIWSYWHEEGMLVQTMAAISLRFQNRRSSGSDRDPLVNLELDPLRPLNNFLWGYIQDEQHRLSVVRRAYEYDHHYGITLEGKAVPKLRSADSRSKFLEGFHSLLQLCSEFFKQDDDTTVIADGFPLLNALKEVHLLLTQGGGNQYGDLPFTARQEMLMMQWLLARPEMREFLQGRVMVANVEPWMDRVDAMKALQGWTDTSATHFRDLGVFGEQLLLSIRYGAWSTVFDPNQAANWARYWRPGIQGYQHAYRAVTGVELRGTAGAADATPPSVHLRNRLAAQGRGR